MRVRVRMFLFPFLLLFPLAFGYADAIYFLRRPAILFEITLHLPFPYS